MLCLGYEPTAAGWLVSDASTLLWRLWRLPHLSTDYFISSSSGVRPILPQALSRQPKWRNAILVFRQILFAASETTLFSLIKTKTFLKWSHHLHLDSVWPDWTIFKVLRFLQKWSNSDSRKRLWVPHHLTTTTALYVCKPFVKSTVWPDVGIKIGLILS